MRLTSSDKEVLRAGVQDVDALARWYWGKELLPHQKAIHQAPQLDITMLGGAGSGKTVGVALSGLSWCTLVPGFKFLNVSISSYQAGLPFNYLRAVLDTSPRYHKFVKDVKSKPYPLIELWHGSVMEFMTVGYEAENLRGYEGCWINFDEAGYETKELTMAVLRTRLRGTRPDGSRRLGRLSVTTTPTDVPWLKQRYLAGVPGSDNYDPKHFYSLRVRTRDNTTLSLEQIEAQERALPDELRRVELDAEFPENPESEFTTSQIEAVTDRRLNARLESLVDSAPPIPGAALLEVPGVGIVLYEMPYEMGHQYVMAGDPGSGDPPKRNAGVLMCFDVTVQPHEMVYFRWVYGGGSILPFVAGYRYVLDKYHPFLRGLDATGPQKGIDELAFQQHGIAVDSLNLQREKMGMLNSLKYYMTRLAFLMPFIKGLFTQLQGYRLPDDKIAQDTVSCLSQITFLLPHVSGDTEAELEGARTGRYRVVRGQRW